MSSDKKLPFPELEATLLEALNTAGIGLTVTADHGDRLERLYINEAGARLLGYSLDEAADMPPMMPVAPDQMPRLLEIRERLKAGEPLPRMLDTVVIARDGTRIPVECGFATTEVDGVPATVAFVRDISRRIDVEEALRQSEARFRSLAELAPDTITVIADGKWAYANRRAVETLGFDSMEEYMARAPLDQVPPEQRPIMAARMKRVMQGETLPPLEYVGIRKDGSRVTMEISSVRVSYQGRPAVLAIGRDVSERKRAQADMMRRDRLAAVGQLAAGVAHEINNPLTYVLLHLNRLRERVGELRPDDLDSVLEEVVDGAGRIRDVVGDLLSFARSPDGDGAPIDIARALESTIRLAGHAVRHVARVEVDFADVPVVHANAARLSQVFLNIILNAAQSFAGDDRDHNHVAVSLAPDGHDFVVVRVTDNGTGIAEEHLSRIFDPFFTTKPAGKGTGLGLAITRSIVDSIGGEISVCSTVGMGTTVTVRLPVGAPSREMPAIVATPRPARRARIMIVDDEVSLARALATTFSEHHDVAVSSDPNEALRTLLDGEPYDAVVCDLLMPRLTGMELFERATAERPEYESRFVFITGGATTPEAAQFAAAQRHRVLAKPFDPAVLLSAVADRLR